MEIFYLEEPTIERKDDAIEFVNEFIEHKSDINGSGGLDRFIDDYEGWLKKIENDGKMEQPEGRVPALTYFLTRENDNKIVGMINIRLRLNNFLMKHGGHIGYSIRPSERGKGYNKINLYLGLKVCDKYGIDKVLMDANLDNPASWKTMEALGGIRTKEYFDDEIYQSMVVDYNIDVKNALEKYKNIYEPYISIKKDVKEQYDCDNMNEMIKLIPYSDEDYEFVYEVKKNAYKKYVEECWGLWVEEDQRKYFEKFITTVKNNAFIIMDRDKKIGFYNGEILDNGNYEVGNICIIPEYQGKGIGTKILENVLEENKDKDIEIQYFKQNPVGKLYERLGFVPNGKTEYHYQMIKQKDKEKTK